MKEDSGPVWYEFTSMMAVVSLLMLCALLLYSGRMPAMQPLVFQFGLTVLAFPVVFWLYHTILGIASLLEFDQ